MQKFKNEGFGWICVACGIETGSTRSRLLVEGEAEDKSPRLSQQGLARWSDREKKHLECTNCGAKERVRD